MNNRQKQRLCYIGLLALGLTMATSLILYAFKQNLNVFYTPSQVQRQSPEANYRFRLGGVVKVGSTKRDKAGLGITFTITDFKHEILVYYVGILPDLFREGKGVIAEGSLNGQGLFHALTVLAKHDENYKPKVLTERQ